MLEACSNLYVITDNGHIFCHIARKLITFANCASIEQGFEHPWDHMDHIHDDHGRKPVRYRKTLQGPPEVIEDDEEEEEHDDEHDEHEE
jgi:hypothetical protein